MSSSELSTNANRPGISIRHRMHAAIPYGNGGPRLLLKLVGLPQNLWVERRAGSPRQTHSVPVCSPPSRRVAPLRPRCAGLTAWTPAARTSVPALV